jgi:ubiquinone/menaquinone biosynthesis C-methylase UbiE
MKILESRPKRYDKGIAWLSRGQSEKIKARIVREHVQPGTRMLEIGVGTGTLAVMAAKKGASVLGFDICEAMLKVAREKVAEAKLGDNVRLREMGVGGMDSFADGSFDLVCSTLVFSELTKEEQTYALRHALRILTPGGKLALADEVKPTTTGKRLLHALARAPVALVTYLVTQSTTNAVRGLMQMVAEAGFVVDREERSSLDSFMYLVARKG